MSLPDKNQRVRRAWMVLAAAAVLGPLIGGLVFTFGVLVLDPSKWGDEGTLVTIGSAAFISVFGGYLVGLVPAVFAGIFAAFRMYSTNTLSLRYALICSLLGGIGGSAAYLMVTGTEGAANFSLVVVAMSLLSGSVLWFALRRYISVPEATEAKGAVLND